ncbi:hypothetical protein [Streptomyces sp. NPDC020489]|uniref:hypothetical protein n=1 Tax=Streptomyces sp. NPDC020489 TaxID=3365077 RepID=UPI0037B94759
MSGVAPQDDEHGRPVHLELCLACGTGDVGRPPHPVVWRVSSRRTGSWEALGADLRTFVASGEM